MGGGRTKYESTGTYNAPWNLRTPPPVSCTLKFMWLLVELVISPEGEIFKMQRGIIYYIAYG